MNPYIQLLVDGVNSVKLTIRNNTNGVAFFVNQTIIMLMLFDVIHWTEAQMFGFLAFVNAGMALVVGKTTVPGTIVDKRVEERVAHITATTNAERLTGATGPQP